MALPRHEFGVLLEIVGKRAQDHDGIEATPTFEHKVIHTPASHRPPPPDPHLLLVSKRRRKITYFLSISKFLNNARSETVAKLLSFRESWKNGWRCIIPAESFYEPNWESGKAVRWLIQQPGEVPMGIAGIYRKWRHPNGLEQFTFAMLTVNADGHPVMQRFHKPEDEKRMVVILDPKDYGDWLSCPVAEAPKYFKQWQGPLDAFAAPLPPRVPKSSSVRTARPPPPETPDLF